MKPTSLLLLLLLGAGAGAAASTPPTCLVRSPPVPPSNSSLVGKRAVDTTCAGHRSHISAAYAACAARARAGEQAARAGNPPPLLLKAIFKDDSEETRGKIAEHLAQIAAECEKKGRGATRLSCGPCSKGVAGLTVLKSASPRGSNPVTLCDSVLNKAPALISSKPRPEASSSSSEEESCARQDLGDVLLHELSHSWGRTDDKGYGMQNILRLSSGDSLQNADSYSHYCKGVKLGCGVGDFTPGTKVVVVKGPARKGGNGAEKGGGEGEKGDKAGGDGGAAPPSAGSNRPRPAGCRHGAPRGAHRSVRPVGGFNESSPVVAGAEDDVHAAPVKDANGSGSGQGMRWWWFSSSGGA